MMCIDKARQCRQTAAINYLDILRNIKMSPIKMAPIKMMASYLFNKVAFDQYVAMGKGFFPIIKGDDIVNIL
jgi:hypothetical protein